MNRTTRHAGGLSLVETLVALAVLAIGLIAALQAGSSGADFTRELRLRQFAAYAADNAIVRLRIEAVPVSNLAQHMPCPQAGFAFVCQQSSAPTAHPRFRETRVDVRLPAEANRLLAQRSAILPLER